MGGQAPTDSGPLHPVPYLPEGDVGKDTRGVGPAGACPPAQAQGKSSSAIADGVWKQA